MRAQYLLFGLLLLTQGLFGCSESTESGSSSSSGGVMPAGKVVINEIGATGEEWVEITNVGDAAFDLQQFAVTDQLADGTPNTAEAARFQAGTSLLPGEYLVVVGKVKTPLPGPQTDCLMTGGPASCYQAAWGISASNGDKIFFLSDTDAIVEAAAYPANAAPTGSTYGRLPDGTGEFATTKPTPGEPNVGP